MHIYALVTGLLMLFMSIIWTTNGMLNTLIKMTFILCSVWSAYMLFGPTNLIALF